VDTHNERVKLFATMLNNLGVATIIAGIVAPAVTGAAGDLTHIGAWFAFGADLIVLARRG
jgi:hypothetical protein